MKSKLLKFGLFFLTVIVATLGTITVFSESENVKSNTQKNAGKTHENLVDEEKQEVTSNDYIVENNSDNVSKNVASKVQMLSEKNTQLLEKSNQLSEIDALRKKHQEMLDKHFSRKHF